MAVVIDANSQIPSSDTSTINQTIGKRKRSLDGVKLAVNGTERDNAETQQAKRKDVFDNILTDVLELLTPLDTNPSILNCPIITCVDQNRASKRPKLSTEVAPLNESTSITSLVTSHAYQNVEEFGKDVATAIASVTSTVENSRDLQTAAFEQEMSSLLRLIVDQNSSMKWPVERRASAPTVKDEDTRISDSLLDLSAQPDVALVVHGTANSSNMPPKDLFSSLRHSKGSQTLPDPRNSAIPNFLSLAEVRPSHSIKTKESGEAPPSIGQLFAPPPRLLKPLEVPTQSSQTTTRGQSVSWYNHTALLAPPVRASNRESYYNQPLRSGKWLSYNASTAASQAPSAGEKRKQRDRALSTGEPYAELTEEEQESARVLRETQQQAKNDALFKSAYSSFAPSYDNENAVVPLQLKSRVWWHKFGQDKYRKLNGYQEAEGMDYINQEGYHELNNETDENQLFKEAVDSFEEDHNESPLGLRPKKYLESEADLADKEVDEILCDITDLLGTLNSYNRNRNLSLATQTQTSAGQNKALTELSGDPANPSAAEIELAQMLENQLSILIASLPPYAVAKLDGEQLAELNVSSKIQIEGPNYPGQMPDPDLTKQAPAVTANASSAARPQSSMSARPHLPTAMPQTRGTYTPTHATPATTYSQVGRPPTSQFNYTTQQGPLNRNYPQYPPQTPTAHGGQFANGSRQFPTPNGFTTYPHQYSPPVASPNAARAGQYIQRPSQPGYQQRAQAQASQTYSTYGMPAARAGSPPNPPPAYLGATQRISHPAVPTPTAAQRLNAQAVSQNAISELINRMTPEEKQMTILRHQQMQMAQMRNSGSGTGTPQLQAPPAQTNGTPTPTVQQNGEGVKQDG